MGVASDDEDALRALIQADCVLLFNSAEFRQLHQILGRLLENHDRLRVLELESQQRHTGHMGSISQQNLGPFMGHEDPDEGPNGDAVSQEATWPVAEGPAARANGLLPYLSTHVTSVNPAVLTSPPAKSPHKRRQRQGRKSTASPVGKGSRQTRQTSSLREILNPSTAPEASPATASPAKTPTLAWWRTGGFQSVGSTPWDDDGTGHRNEAEVGFPHQTPRLTPVTPNFSIPSSPFFDGDFGDACLL